MDIIEQSQKDVKIHKDHLEDDWETHSEIALLWHLRYAEAINKRDKVKELLSHEEAKKAIEIRSDPREFGFEKITENGISELIKTDIELGKLRNDLLSLDYTVNQLKGVTTAFEHRKKALEEEVALYIAGYFSPKLKAELKPEIDTQVKLLNRK